jgi:hypothetical protein
MINYVCEEKSMGCFDICSLITQVSISFNNDYVAGAHILPTTASGTSLLETVSQ